MFDLRKIINGRINVPEPDFLPVTGEEVYSEGEALVVKDGKLTKAGATEKPQVISLKNYTASAEGGEELPCYIIDRTMRFEVPITISGSGAIVGSKVTLAADALGVTDTTEKGVVTIVDTLGAKKTGDKVVVII